MTDFEKAVCLMMLGPIFAAVYMIVVGVLDHRRKKERG